MPLKRMRDVPWTDPGDAQTHAVMATVFEKTSRFREAADALRRALSIDPLDPEWLERAAALKGCADYDALPPDTG